MGAPELAAIVTASCACVTDVKWRRIPNLLTGGAALGALVFHLLQGGSRAGLVACEGWAVAVAIFLPFFALGGMGGGDIKLLAALGAWLGPWPTVHMAFWTAVAGGVMAVIVAIAIGYLGTALLNLRLLVAHWMRVGLRPHPKMTLESADAPRLPYALPIAIGLGLTLWLR